MKRFASLIFIILLASCSEPQIDIHSPQEGQTFGTEYYVNIDATITDNDGIKRCTYISTYGGFSNTETIMLDSIMPTSYELHGLHTMTALATGSPVEIKIEAEDMNGVIGAKKVTVYHN